MIRLLAFAALAFSDAPGGDDPATLVRNLGNPSYRTREAAARELARAGVRAEAALIRGASDTDPEVAERCRRLLTEVRRADLDARLRLLLAGGPGHRLPGWERFRKIAGDGPEARALFAASVRTDAGLLAALDAGPAAVAKPFVERVKYLGERLPHRWSDQLVTGVPPEEVVAVLLTVTQPEVVIDADTEGKLLPVFYGPAFQSRVMAETPEGHAVRRLLVAWAERHRTDEPTLNATLSILTAFQIRDGLPLALKAAKANDASVSVRSNAIQFIGRFGTGANVADLRPLFGETGLVFERALSDRPATRVELGDVALGMAVLLSGQNLIDYNFNLPLTFAAEQGHRYTVRCYGFANDENRQAARRKWAEYEAQCRSR